MKTMTTAQVKIVLNIQISRNFTENEILSKVMEISKREALQEVSSLINNRANISILNEPDVIMVLVPEKDK